MALMETRTQKKKSEMETLTQNLGLDSCSNTKLGLSFIQRESMELNERNCSIYSASVRLSVYEEYFGMCWLSACYPLDRRLISLDQQWKYRELANLANPVLESAIPEPLRKLGLVDDDDMKVSGESTNIASFLCDGDRLVRHDGERIVLDMDTFRGKYVLVCCFNVPVLWGSYRSQALLSICHELVFSIDNLEIVMVARMNTLADTETVFNNFFKAFPSSCLAVPYEESERRDHICKLLNLGVDLTCSLYGIDGTVLPSLCVCPFVGAEAFPFTRESRLQIAAQNRKLRKSSLDQILRLKPCDSPPAVYKFNPTGGLREEVLISDLIRNKHVGLYMCTDGSLIPILHKLYEQCRSKQQEFEIVVLYCPFSEMLDSEFFKAKIDQLLQEQNVCGWWCLPFNNSVSQRFGAFTWKYIGSTHPSVDYGDKLIIVGPDGKILDMYGAEVIKYHGIDAYPFTREASVEEEMKKVREITLESILVSDVYRGFDRRDTISAGELVSSKKKVIVYMDVLHDNDSDSDSDTWLQKLVTEYEEVKKNRGTEFEMVFINNSYEDPESSETGEVDALCIKEMPWFVYPHNGKRSSSLKDLRKLVCDFALVGFGEDGRLCSFKSPMNLDAVLSCMSDTLGQDIYLQFGYDFCAEM